MKKTAKKAEKKQSGGGQLIEGEGVSRAPSDFLVPVERLSPYPEWHKDFDVRSRYKPDEGIVANILLIGAHHTAISAEVVKHDTEIEGRDGELHVLPAGIYIVDGHQRFNAAMEAKRLLRARGQPDDIVVKVDPENRGGKRDDDLIATLQIALNRHVGDDPLVTAQKLKALSQRCGGDLALTASRAGRPLVFVRRHLALLGADKAVQKAVQAGTVSVSAASELARLPAKEQRAEIENNAAIADGAAGGGKITVRSTRAKSRPEGPVPPTRKEIKVFATILDRLPHPDALDAYSALRWVLTGEREGVMLRDDLVAALKALGKDS